MTRSSVRPVALALGVLTLVAVPGCSTPVAPSGIWFRVVGGGMEVSPCRDLEIDRIVLEVSLAHGGRCGRRLDWDRITVTLAGPAGEHRSNVFAPNDSWAYAATGGFFGASEPDECDAPAA